MDRNVGDHLAANHTQTHQPPVASNAKSKQHKPRNTDDGLAANEDVASGQKQDSSGSAEAEEEEEEEEHRLHQDEVNNVPEDEEERRKTSSSLPLCYDRVSEYLL